MADFKTLFEQLPENLRPAVVAALELFVEFERNYKKSGKKGAPAK